MSKEMEEKYNKRFEEMSKSVNNTLGNQEKTIKQVMETVKELKAEMEAMKKTNRGLARYGKSRSTNRDYRIKNNQ